MPILIFTFINFQLMPNYPKPGHLENQCFLLFDMACVDFPFVTPITFTINMRHTRGFFAKTCITMCADMNI